MKAFLFGKILFEAIVWTYIKTISFFCCCCWFLIVFLERGLLRRSHEAETSECLTDEREPSELCCYAKHGIRAIAFAGAVGI